MSRTLIQLSGEGGGGRYTAGPVKSIHLSFFEGFQGSNCLASNCKGFVHIGCGSVLHIDAVVFGLARCALGLTQPRWPRSRHGKLEKCIFHSCSKSLATMSRLGG